MTKTFMVIDKSSDWKPYYPDEGVITVYDYLINWDQIIGSGSEKIKIINLCRKYNYLSNGYYCSLLAEARGHSVVPTVSTVLSLLKPSIYHFEISDLDIIIKKILKKRVVQEKFSIRIFFGHTSESDLEEIARKIFDHYQCPIIEVFFEYDKSWEISAISTLSINNLSVEEEDIFAEALDNYSRKVWKKPRAKKNFRYDLAILYNPKDPLAPSNDKAIKKFIQAGRENDINVELVERKDINKIAEYDALFIRDTTGINHYTYRFAKKAEVEGLVVIDDPVSILRCTNKIYLENLVSQKKISTPKTIIYSKEQFEKNGHIKINELGINFPFIVKIPDGSFSKGVLKVKDKDDFYIKLKELFKKSTLLLLQEYIFTDFDWRIGILNQKIIFASKYYMSKGHWQIYNHEADNKKDTSGDFETVAINQVPKIIQNTALKAANLIGNSLYGVDLKQSGDQAFLIEINDNPNIDEGIEDVILGDELYQIIMRDFIRRIENKNES